MDFILKNLAHLTKLIGWLNLKKVLLLSSAALVMLTLYTAYEQRVRVAQLFAEEEGIELVYTFAVSAQMQDQIKYLVAKNSLIKSISVLTANIHLNRRTIVYRFSEDMVANETFNKMTAERGMSQPIFNEDDANNKQMVSLINGEFACTPFKDSINMKLVPSLAAASPMICRVSLPPYYGDFAGYLSIVLVKVPTPSEEKELEQIVKQLASELFFKDVQRR
jgi:hypothetical protein